MVESGGKKALFLEIADHKQI